MRVVINVEIEVKDGTPKMDILSYVTEAIESHGGGLDPDDTMYGRHKVYFATCDRMTLAKTKGAYVFAKAQYVFAKTKIKDEMRKR